MIKKIIFLSMLLLSMTLPVSAEAVFLTHDNDTAYWLCVDSCRHKGEHYILYLALEKDGDIVISEVEANSKVKMFAIHNIFTKDIFGNIVTIKADGHWEKYNQGSPVWLAIKYLEDV